MKGKTPEYKKAIDDYLLLDGYVLNSVLTSQEAFEYLFSHDISITRMLYATIQLLDSKHICKEYMTSRVGILIQCINDFVVTDYGGLEIDYTDNTLYLRHHNMLFKYTGNGIVIVSTRIVSNFQYNIDPRIGVGKILTNYYLQESMNEHHRKLFDYHYGIFNSSILNLDTHTPYIWDSDIVPKLAKTFLNNIPPNNEAYGNRDTKTIYFTITHLLSLYESGTNKLFSSMFDISTWSLVYKEDEVYHVRSLHYPSIVVELDNKFLSRHLLPTNHKYNRDLINAYISYIGIPLHTLRNAVMNDVHAMSLTQIITKFRNDNS